MCLLDTTAPGPLRVVIQPQNTDGAFCGTLWSDPSGQHLTAACAWDAHTGTVDNGHFTPGRNLHPQAPGSDGGGGGGDLIAWVMPENSHRRACIWSGQVDRSIVTVVTCESHD